MLARTLIDAKGPAVVYASRVSFGAKLTVRHARSLAGKELMMSMLETYRAHVAERAALGIPPLPLSAKQTEGLIALLRSPPAGEEAFLVDLLTHRVPAGVDDAARIKAGFLDAVAKGDEKNALVSRKLATELLGTMLGGFNIKPLIDLLRRCRSRRRRRRGPEEDPADVRLFPRRQGAGRQGRRQRQGRAAVLGRRRMVHLASRGAGFAHRDRVQGQRRDQHRRSVAGARRLDPSRHPAARPGHAEERPAGHRPRRAGRARPDQAARGAGRQGPSRSPMSATSSAPAPRASRPPIPCCGSPARTFPIVPNKRFGGVCLGTKIAPIFYNTMEDAGALPIELDVSKMEIGDVVELRPYEGKALKNGEVISEFTVKSDVIFDEVRAGGRIPLIIGRGLTAKRARSAGPARLHPVPPAGRPRRHRQGLHAGPEDGRPRLRSARRQGHAPRHLLRAEDDHRRLAGHHRPDDPRRTEGSRLPRLLRRSGDAVLLPHRRLSEAGRRPDPPRAAGLHLEPRRRRPASGRRRHPFLAQPPAAARHRRHRRRQPHPLPDRHFLPGRLRPRGLRGGDRRHAARHAGIRAGPLQGRDAAGHHPARPGQRHSAVRRSRPAR